MVFGLLCQKLLHSTLCATSIVSLSCCRSGQKAAPIEEAPPRWKSEEGGGRDGGRDGGQGGGWGGGQSGGRGGSWEGSRDGGLDGGRGGGRADSKVSREGGWKAEVQGRKDSSWKHSAELGGRGARSEGGQSDRVPSGRVRARGAEGGVSGGEAGGVREPRNLSAWIKSKAKNSPGVEFLRELAQRVGGWTHLACLFCLSLYNATNTSWIGRPGCVPVCLFCISVSLSGLPCLLVIVMASCL